MKKLFVLILTLILLSSTLIACGVKEEASSSNAAVTVNSLSSSEPETKMSDASTSMAEVKESSSSSAAALSTSTTGANSATTMSSDSMAHGSDTFVFTQRMGDLSDKLIPLELMDDVDAWFQEIWAQKPLIDWSQGSLYDFVHKFNIPESNFRERNKNLYEPYSEENISDLYNLSKEAFLKKYASSFMLVKGETVLSLKWLSETDESAWAKYGVTKQDVTARLDAIESAAPELAKEMKSLLEDKLR